METTTMGFIGCILGLYWDNGKENGNYYSILRLTGDPTKGLGFRGLRFRD